MKIWTSKIISTLFVMSHPMEWILISRSDSAEELQEKKSFSSSDSKIFSELYKNLPVVSVLAVKTYTFRSIWNVSLCGQRIFEPINIKCIHWTYFVWKYIISRISRTNILPETPVGEILTRVTSFISDLRSF